MKTVMAGVLLAGLLAGCQQEQAAMDAPTPAGAAAVSPLPAVGDSGLHAANQPGLELATVDGGQFNLIEHRGHWVLVNFWASWCSPCLEEMPELSQLDQAEPELDVVGLAYEDSTPEQMLEFLQQHPVSYPIALLDINQPPADFEVPRGLPGSYLLDPQGRVVKGFLGPVTAAMIKQAMQ